jgi:hypothetical protein
MEHAAPHLVSFGVMAILGFVVVPIWMLAGLADYFCHRGSDIEHTSGAPESIMHLTQFGLVGLPLAAGLFFKVDAGVLMLMALFVVLHHTIAYVDVRYANQTRVVRPIEQIVHSFLELLPVTAFLLMVCLEFDQLEGILGFGGAEADFAFHLRTPPLPVWYVLPVLLGALIMGLAPYLEELYRCLRVQCFVSQAGRVSAAANAPDGV